MIKGFIGSAASIRGLIVGLIALTACCVVFLGSAPAGVRTSQADSLSVTFSPGQIVGATLVMPAVDGAYASENIDMKFVSNATSPIPLLLSGQVDTVFFGVPSAVIGAYQGSPPLKMIYALIYSSSTLYLAARNDVKSLADCKRVGALGPPSTAWHWAKIVQAKGHYTNWDIIPVNSGTAQTAALVSGQIDCSFATYATHNAQVDAGQAHFLINPENPKTIPKGVNANVVGTGVLTTDDWLKSHHDLAVRLIKALDKGRKDLFGLPPTQVAQMLSQNTMFAGFDIPTMADALVHSKPVMTPFDGYVPRSNWRAIQAYMIQGGEDWLNPADPKWSYDNFVDMSYYFEALGGKRTSKSDATHNTLVKLAAALYGDRTLSSKLYTYNKDLFAKRGVSPTKAQTYALPAGTTIRY
jgi:ABC-type nitrate/sulfonate/bicarbonate transport system substrate-binding protein